MLLALALAAQAVPVPIVEHNHFYVTVDRPTFEAIRQSKWLREEFANVSVSTHASGDDQWTGIYVSGVGTYVEIFCEGEDFRLGQPRYQQQSAKRAPLSPWERTVPEAKRKWTEVREIKGSPPTDTDRQFSEKVPSPPGRGPSRRSRGRR